VKEGTPPVSDHFLSLIRTWVPIAVGAGLTWAASKTGIVIDESTSAAGIAFATGAATAGYYTLARALEKVSPAFGVLLGSSKTPAYTAPAAKPGE
jgi:hypothetical protein